VSAVDSEGRTIWIADAHRGDGKRFVARADEKLTAFIELESAANKIRVNRRAGQSYGLQYFNQATSTKSPDSHKSFIPRTRPAAICQLLPSFFAITVN
jgi:hypothetical protein